MATPTRVQERIEVTPARDQLIQAYRAMYMARRLDDREILLKRQNRIFFQISGAGHEAVQVAAGLVFRPSHDWFYLYYRDRALALMLGVTAEQMLLASVGAATDAASGGRQMPSHWTITICISRRDRRPPARSICRRRVARRRTAISTPNRTKSRWSRSGEGATSEGEFWEAINAACLENLPLVFLVEDNGYAISVPVEKQTAGGNVAQLLAGFPNLKRLEVDGTDMVASYRLSPKQRPMHASAKVPRWCMPTARGLIRTRFPTTRGCIRPRPSAMPKRRAIPCCGSRNGWCRRAFWTGRRCR